MAARAVISSSHKPDPNRWLASQPAASQQPQIGGWQKNII